MLNDSRVARFITDHQLTVTAFRKSSFMAADILFQKLEAGWEITLYSRAYDNPEISRLLVLLALSSIYRRESKWVQSPEMSELRGMVHAHIAGSIQVPTGQQELYSSECRSLIDAFFGAFELWYLLANDYVDKEELALLTDYFLRRHVTIRECFEALAGMAALREVGYDMRDLHEELIRWKAYHLLKVVDTVARCLKRSSLGYAELNSIFDSLFPYLTFKADTLQQLADGLRLVFEDQHRFEHFLRHWSKYHGQVNVLINKAQYALNEGEVALKEQLVARAGASRSGAFVGMLSLHDTDTHLSLMQCGNRNVEERSFFISSTYRSFGTRPDPTCNTLLQIPRIFSEIPHGKDTSTAS
jgi:hypothetical protein